MPDHQSNTSGRFSIVPGEDELLSRPRPGAKTVVKAFSWPTFIIALLAFAGVVALGFIFWQNRQLLMSGNDQVGQLVHTQKLDAQRIASLEKEVGQLDKNLQEIRQQVAEIPVINPDQLNGLEVQISALNLAVQHLNQLTAPQQAQSDELLSVQQSMKAIDQTQSAMSQRMGAIESRLDSLAATLHQMQSPENSHQ